MNKNFALKLLTGDDGATCSACKQTKPLSEFPSYSLTYCKACRVTRTQDWRDADPERAAVLRAESYRKRRLAVLTYYSKGSPKCACCEEPTYEFLSLDHVEGGGTKQRKEIHPGSGFYHWIIKNNFPEGFRVLCHNCNQAIGHYGKCPHKSPS